MVKAVALLLRVLALVASSQASYHRRLKTKQIWNYFPNGRIVGGVDTDITQVPYQVQLLKYDSQTCGGSIISATYVLTAAHCTYSFEAWELKVRYGTTKLNSGGTIVHVAEIAQHPQYNIVTFDFDVCVLHLENKISFSDKAKPIALASVEPTVGEDALVSGWGILSLNGVQPEQLQSVVVPVISREECSSAYNKFSVTENMICGGAPGKGGCSCDSGGPFVTNNVQSGITSWSYDCAGDHYPTGFANVAALREFIDTNSEYTACWV